MRHFVIRILLFILMFVCLTSSLFAIAEEQNTKTATVMIYMCGADLEYVHRQGTMTLATIKETGFNTECVNVVALLGGSEAWKGGYDPSQLTLVELGGRRPVKAKTWDVNSMGEPDTLTNYLDYCVHQYPAEKYYLIIWDHGGGPNYGVCFDSLYHQDSLSINELASALANSPFAEKKLEVIAFNTCLTSSMEFAMNMSPFAKYMVATEDSMYGLDYEWLKTVDTDESALLTATHIVENTFSFNQRVIEEGNKSEINSVAAIDLKKIDDVAQAMDAFFKNVTAYVNHQTFSEISRDRNDTTEFGVTESGGARNRDLVDLGNLVLHLKSVDPETANQLLSALDEAVPVREAMDDDLYGLTVYHPFSNKAQMAEVFPTHNGIQMSNSYSDYIQKFASILTDTPLASWKNLETGLMARKDNRTLFSLPLTEEQAENLISARLYVLEKQEDESYRFIFDSCSASKEDLLLTGEYSGTALYAVANGEAISAPLTYEITQRNEWLIPAVLSRSETGEDAGFTANGLISCTIDPQSKELIPGTVYLLDEASGGYSGISRMVFTDFSEVSFPLISRRETRNELGVLLSYQEWETDRVEMWTTPIDGSWEFCLLNDTIDTADLYAVFQITDSQYNLYSSEPHVVKAEASAAGEVRVTYDDLGFILINNFSATYINGSLNVSMEVENLADREAIVSLENLSLNGQMTDAAAEAFGSGDNWGLLHMEQQYMTLSLSSLPVTGNLTEMRFDLVLKDAITDEAISTVPVQVSLSLVLSGL